MIAEGRNAPEIKIKAARKPSAKKPAAKKSKIEPVDVRPFDTANGGDLAIKAPWDPPAGPSVPDDEIPF